MALSMKKKIKMLRKLQWVCYDLKRKSSGGTVSRGPRDSGLSRVFVCVCVKSYGCMHLFADGCDELGGETANRTSGLVTALINLPVGHKSLALLSPVSPHRLFHSLEGSRYRGYGYSIPPTAKKFLATGPPVGMQHTTMLIYACMYA